MDGFYRSGRVSFSIPFGWFLQFPIWFVAAAAALVLGPMWFVGRKVRRWRDAGRCPSCGYDLTGTTGPCPECGGEA